MRVHRRNTHESQFSIESIRVLCGRNQIPIVSVTLKPDGVDQNKKSHYTVGIDSDELLKMMEAITMELTKRSTEL